MTTKEQRTAQILKCIGDIYWETESMLNLKAFELHDEINPHFKKKEMDKIWSNLKNAVESIREMKMRTDGTVFN